MPAAKILITCLRDPSKKPRVYRMIHYCLESGFDLEILSPPPVKKLEGVIYHNFQFSIFGIKSRLIRVAGKAVTTVFQKFVKGVHRKSMIMGIGHGFQKLQERLSKRSYDLILVEDLDMLPFAFSVKNKAAIVMDAREYYPRQREHSLLFNIFQAPYRSQFCATWLKKCDAVITVSPGLAKEYERIYNVRPHLVMSVPNKVDLRMRKREDVSIKLVHHGVANRNRKLENMIEIFKRLDERFHFDLYLTGPSPVIQKLKKAAESIPRLRIVPPVKLEQIIPTISQYDIGFFYVEPVTFNLKHCLPNKLFEFIQARLAVAIGPSPDMSDVVTRFGCGFIAEHFTVESMASVLNNLTLEEIESAKDMSDKASRELCFEVEREKVDVLFHELISPTITSSSKA